MQLIILGLAIVGLAAFLFHLYRERSRYHLARNGEEHLPPGDVGRRMLAKYEQMHLLSRRITSGITVGDIMTAPPDCLDEHLSVKGVRSMMGSLRVHHALVQDANGRLVGIISDRDVTQRRGLEAWQIMTRDPISVTPDCTPMRAVGLMISKRISCLPVVEAQKLCGLVTTTDLLLTLEAVLKMIEELCEEDREKLGTGRLETRNSYANFAG